MPDTAGLDRDVAVPRSSAAEWVATPLAEKRRLLAAGLAVEGGDRASHRLLPSPENSHDRRVRRGGCQAEGERVAAPMAPGGRGCQSWHGRDDLVAGRDRDHKSLGLIWRRTRVRGPADGWCHDTPTSVVAADVMQQCRAR